MNYVIHHSPCLDGDMAAYIAKKYFAEQKEQVELIGENLLNQQYDLSRFKMEDIIYFLDCCYPLDITNQLAAMVKKITILDHHKSNIEIFDNPSRYLSNICPIFDINRSGAGLAWDYFFDKNTRPQLVNYIEDIDLWRHNLLGSDQFLAWIDSLENINFEELLDKFPKRFLGSDIFWIGDAILKYNKKLINTIIQKGYATTINGCKAFKVNSPLYELTSQLGNEIYMKYKCIAWIWHETTENGKRIIKNSLRCNATDPYDVSEIAKLHGGGGHKAAAAFIDRID